MAHNDSVCELLKVGIDVFAVGFFVVLVQCFMMFLVLEVVSQIEFRLR